MYNYKNFIDSLKNKARNQYDIDILNTIIMYYNNINGFYESDVIRVFDNYLNTGVLNFN